MSGQQLVDPIEATQFLKEVLNVGKPIVQNEMSGHNVVHEEQNHSSFKGNKDGNLLETLFKSSTNKKQHIVLPGSDDQVSFPIIGSEVIINPSPCTMTGSSKVQVNNLVNHTWDFKYNQGRMIAIHISSNYIAYSVKVHGSLGNVVRVMNSTSCERGLIKGMRGEVKDIGFAYTTSPVLLALVDEIGDFFVYDITENANHIICKPIIRMDRPSNTNPSNFNRVIWCPYIPEDPNIIDEEISKLIVVTHNSQAEIWNVHQLMSEFEEAIFNNDNQPKDVITIVEHTEPITNAIFSPDGNALATASLDGEVKFFQTQGNKPDEGHRCLHQWVPHDSKPISCLFFLDNHTVFNPEVQFWKYAITGASNNQELKLWSCQTWTCIQTISFVLKKEDKEGQYLMAYIDHSSSYLLLSDIMRKVLYILQISQDPTNNQVQICSLAEFSLAYPVLSLAIQSFTPCKIKSTNGRDEIEFPNGQESDKELELGEIEDETQELLDATLAKLYWIESRSLQSASIVYQPADVSEISPANIKKENYDTLSDIGLSGEATSCLSGYKLGSGLGGATSEVLLTPDDFTSSNSTATSQHDLSSNRDNNADNNAVGQHPGHPVRRKSSQHSTTSSPSREVEQIMAPKYTSQEEANDDDDEEDEEEEEVDVNHITDIKLEPPSPSGGIYREQSWPTENLGAPSMPIIHDNPAGDQLVDLNRFLPLLEEDRKEMRELNKRLKYIEKNQERLQNFLQIFETNVLTRIEESQIQVDNQRMEKQTNTIIQNVNSRIEKVIQAEMKRNVAPAMDRLLEESRTKIDKELSLGLASLDTSIKNNLANLIQSKSFNNTLLSNIVPAIQTQVQSSCSQMFQASVIPAFEKASQTLFQQLNEVFHKGTKEYMNHIEGCLDMKLNSFQSNVEKSLNQMKENVKQSASQNIKTGTQALQTFFASQQQDFSKGQDFQLHKFREILQEEFRQFSQEQQMIKLRSSAPTPNSMVAPQIQEQHLKVLIQQGNYNEAFQAALSAADLSLVTYVCKSISPDKVFPMGSPCILLSPVLLSLIHQLSGDLTNHSEIKVRYLEEAIMHYDTSDPVVREHMGKVNNTLKLKLKVFISENPNHPLMRRIKLILMALGSLNES